MPNEWREPIRKHLASLNLAPTREAEIIEEFSQHAEDRYRELLDAGATKENARRLALNEVLATELKGVERINAPQALVTDPKAHFLSGISQDIRYGFRTLTNNPRFTAIAMLALALGIGANTALFSVINGVLLQPLAYHDSSRIVRVFETSPQFGKSSVAYMNYLDWRNESHSFTDMAAFRGDDFNFTGSGRAEKLAGLYVTASLLPTLGAAPALGRYFLPEEDRPGVGCSAMLSYGFWQRRFGGDPGIQARSLILNSVSCSVIGVLPKDFRLGDEDDVYIPIEQWKTVQLRDRDSHPGLRVIARLKPGVSIEAANTEMVVIAERQARQYPKTNAGHGAQVLSMKDEMVASVRPTLLLLASAVGFVLIIACANVANLLLARSTARTREFAIRTALGAEPWRVIRQLLIESVMLSLGAAAVGVLLAYWGTGLVLSAVPGSLPRSREIGIDPYVLLFTLAVAVITGIAFGLAPAFQGANANPQESLKEGTRGAGGGRRRSEGVFVAVETGLAVVLLAGAGLMIQSVWRLLQVDPGFKPSHVVTMQLALSPTVMTSPQGIRNAYEQLQARVASIPGVQANGVTALVPLGDSDSENGFWLGSGPQPPQEKLFTGVSYIVTPGYLGAMQIPLLRGRFFNDRDAVKAPVVLVIDDVLAKHYFPNQDPIGKQISLVVLGPAQIIGVVGHVKQWGLDSDDSNQIRDQIYFSLMQVPDQYMTAGVAGCTLVVRSKPDPSTVLNAIREQVAGPALDQPTYSVRTMDEVISNSLAARRFTMLVLMIFASTALILAAVGIYGVMSYSVTRRVHEMGIRAALGASRGEIIGMVIGQGMRPAAIGMLIGLGVAVALTRFMANLLYGVKATDPLTLAAVTLLLGTIALLACYIPARRATAVDPVIALRSE